MLQRNRWDTTLPSIIFLESALRRHNAVESFERSQDILFAITRVGDRSPVHVVLVNRYTISLADVIAAKGEFPTMTCIVAVGNWCGYTEEAKEYGLSQGIGVFHTIELLGALNYDNPEEYAAKDGRGRPMYAYRNP